MTNTALVFAEDHLKNLALAVARNRVGIDEPVEDVLAREGVGPAEFSRIMDDPIFKVYTRQYMTELTEKGVSVQLKSRVLFEQSLREVYYIASDPEQPAAARLKGVELLHQWSNFPQAAQQVDNKPSFSISFVMPDGTPTSPQATITVSTNQQASQSPQHSAPIVDLDSSEFSVAFDTSPDAVPVRKTLPPNDPACPPVSMDMIFGAAEVPTA